MHELRKYHSSPCLLGLKEYLPLQADSITLDYKDISEGAFKDARKLNSSNPFWPTDSDEEELSVNPSGTNPFHHSLEQQDNETEPDLKIVSGVSADGDIENFIYCMESRNAVPAYALSDAVFCVDRPFQAVRLGDELPLMELPLNYTVGSVFLLVITKIYTPFQFWFQFQDEVYDSRLMEEMARQMSMFYSSGPATSWKLTKYFMKSGYMCAVYHEWTWKRARIVAEPPSDAKIVSIYLVDYGNDAEVPFANLRFLHQDYAVQPALAMRGTLTDVYPLDLHWTATATAEFLRLVESRVLHASIKEIDLEDCIFFVNLCEKDDFKLTVSDLLISNKMAGRSKNYTEEYRALHCGRRLRYLRESLPTFEMIETQVFPIGLDGFEDKFDDIIYMPSFFQGFQPPKLSNPFLCGLQKALARWLLKYEPHELKWRKLYQEELKRKSLEKKARIEEFYKRNIEQLE